LIQEDKKEEARKPLEKLDEAVAKSKEGDNTREINVR
jgi:hypothetical protein